MNFIIGTIIFLILCLGINSFLNDISSSSKEKKRKEKKSKQNKASIRQGRQNSPKTRKPLHLPIQGLLSLKTATTYSPTVTQYHRRD